MTDLFVFLVTAVIVAYVLWRFWRVLLAVFAIGCFALVFAVSTMVYMGVQSLV